MAIDKKKNKQISVTLPLEAVRKLEILSEYELRPRSQLCAKIIIDYLKTVDFSKIIEEDDK